MICAERLLTKLDIKGQFTKELYKNESTIGRTLMSALGYWGPVVPIDIAKGIGIRNIKKLQNKIYANLQEVSIDLIGIDIEARLAHLGVKEHTHGLYNMLKTGEIANIRGLKDLRIKGLGNPRYKLPDYNGQFKTLEAAQYFNHAWRLRSIPRDIWIRLYKLDFPEERIDEIQFAIFTGLDIHKNKLAVILRYLDNIIERDLRESYMDDTLVQYTDKIKDLAKKNKMTLPENGRELKKAALRFKNCAASYVERVLEGKVVIMYNDDHMAQVSVGGDKVFQHYGKRNSKPTVDFKL